jgi:nucleoid DNA-binding protein
VTPSPKPPLTRRDLIEALRSSPGLSAAEAGALVGAFLETIAAQLAEGGVVTLSGLGRFESRFSPARPGRNPATGQPALVPARRRPVFTLSRNLRKMISEGGED